jgi:hypothetical protein
LKYAEGRKGGFDPHARIVDMDADGIDAAFLYPSLGLFAGAVEDPGRCSQSPSRHSARQLTPGTQSCAAWAARPADGHH